MATRRFRSSFPFLQAHRDESILLCPHSDQVTTLGDCLRCPRGNWACDPFVEMVRTYRAALGDPEWEEIPDSVVHTSLFQDPGWGRTP